MIPAIVLYVLGCVLCLDMSLGFADEDSIDTRWFVHALVTIGWPILAVVVLAGMVTDFAEQAVQRRRIDGDE